ncbi:polyprenyl synthetase family protein [Candidatus Thorarchaeota archaeon]|nr:MAG: polyprenyl synthetase family protein [Candidatus Thorarchaeota archaeon]
MKEGSTDEHRLSFTNSEKQSISEDVQYSERTSFLPLGLAIRNRLNLIDNEVAKFTSKNTGTPAALYDAAYYLVRAGGKRLRSLLTYLACEAVNGNLQRILPITVAAELLQTASLIHDDIIDNTEIRRGVTTVHKKFGEKMAILASDLLISQAFEIMGKWGTPELIEQIGRTGIAMCEGEAQDSVMNINELLSFSEEEYLEVAERKTASFMIEAVNIGSAMGKSSKKEVACLIEYAENLGYAFQIRDDVLDFTSDPRVSGKSVLTDLQAGSSNLVLIYALEACESEVKEECVDEITMGNYSLVLELIEDSGAIARATEKAKEYARASKAAIEDMNFPNKELFADLADFAVRRKF